MRNAAKELIINASLQMVTNDPQLYDQAKKIAEKFDEMLVKEGASIAVGIASLRFLLEIASQGLLEKMDEQK